MVALCGAVMKMNKCPNAIFGGNRDNRGSLARHFFSLGSESELHLNIGDPTSTWLCYISAISY